MSMNQASAKKKKKAPRQLQNHRGIMLIALVTAMLLVVSLVVFSYSWFKPEENLAAQGLEAEINATIRSERCTFETYQGTLVTETNWESGGDNSFRRQGYFIDQVAYDSTAIAENAVITIPRATSVTEDGETTVIPGRVYFRTNIQNNDTEHSSVISLYHHEFPDELGLGVTYPSNTYFINDFGDYSDCWILRNAYVKVKDEADVDGPGLLQVEWFVENFDTASTKSIRVTTQTTGLPAGVTAPIQWLYLMYN